MTPTEAHAALALLRRLAAEAPTTREAWCSLVGYLGEAAGLDDGDTADLMPDAIERADAMATARSRSVRRAMYCGEAEAYRRAKIECDRYIEADCLAPPRMLAQRFDRLAAQAMRNAETANAAGPRRSSGS